MLVLPAETTYAKAVLRSSTTGTLMSVPRKADGWSLLNLFDSVLLPMASTKPSPMTLRVVRKVRMFSSGASSSRSCIGGGERSQMNQRATWRINEVAAEINVPGPQFVDLADARRSPGSDGRSRSRDRYRPDPARPPESRARRI